MSTEAGINSKIEDGASVKEPLPTSRRIPAALAFVFALTVMFMVSPVLFSAEVDMSEELGVTSIKDRPVIRGSNSSSHVSASPEATSDVAAGKDSKMKNYQQEEESFSALADIDIKQLLQKANLAKDQMEEQLKREYGDDYADMIFHKHHEIINISNVSEERLKRKMQLKLLGIGGNEFSWMTAGHSAAAAHGNLYHQSYTQSIEDVARDIFASVGLEFKATNFAMGGMRSGPELCFCMEAVYGSDIDVLSWDFGMTDGRDSWKLSCWGSRASALPSRPILALIDGSAGRFSQLQPFELEGGMGTFQMDFARLSQLVTDAPVKSEEELTLAVKYLVCDKKIESTGPCNDFKFNTTEACGPGRLRGQTSWHPGWKVHMLVGRVVGYFLANTLISAVNNLNARHYTNLDSWEIISKTLYDEDISDSLKRANITLPNLKMKVDGMDSETFASLFLSRRNMCRISLRPARSRFEGILTGTGNVGNFRYGFDTGLKERDAKGAEPLEPNKPVPMVYEPTDGSACANATQIDFSDFFLVRGQDGPLSFVFPNSLELAYHGGEPIEEGFIMMCMVLCPWGKCPATDIFLDAIIPVDGNHTAGLEISVNGRSVVGTKTLDQRCHFLENEHGLQWDANENGQYDMKINVRKDGMHFRFTTFTVVHAKP
eukprot:CAMPEP_0196806634 /NCGR_PEP_ID=MMETSP1362-20130617/6546_1 /TAXON_ID=163516 /ORGANISM="Leptocylindrus danicus, Strain CCMP1856" /LENGTH=658 /DNA_ID=CAMNT_0042180211 /DNA_START=198 /DNA_END=2174 /DNA_ORIENTATION=+